MTTQKKIIIILLPLLVVFITRTLSEFISIGSNSQIAIPFMILVGFTLRCVFPFIIVKYLSEIKYSKLIAINIVVLLVFGSLIDLLIMFMLRFEATMAPQFEPTYQMAYNALHWVPQLSSFVSVVTAGIAVVVVLGFKDNLSKILLLFIISIFALYHFVELLGLHSIFGSNVRNLLYDSVYYFNILIGSIVLYLGFREVEYTRNRTGEYVVV